MTTGLLAAAWLLGVLCAAWAPAWTALAAAPACGLGAWIATGRSPRAVMLALACAGLALLGTWRWQVAATASAGDSVIAQHAEAGPVRAGGFIAAAPEERERHQRLTVHLRWIEQGGGRLHADGKVVVRTTLGRPFRAGDVVEAHGNLDLPAVLPGFDYRAYLARQGVVAEMSYPRIVVTGHERPPLMERVLGPARRQIAGALARALPHPESALATGMLTGVRSAIPRDLTEDFNASGTSHLIAISGFNISLLAGVVLTSMAGLVHRRWAAVIAAAAITAYAVFAGPTASVVRALLMGLLMIGTEQLGRPGSPVLALAVAAALMTGQDPRVIDDLGFQLSFTATAGIMLGQPVLQGLTNRLIGAGDQPVRAVLRWWSDLGTVTLAATIATLPVMLHAFGRVPLAGIPANMLAGPLFPVVLLTSTVAAGGSLFLPGLAAISGAIAWPPLALTIAIARLAASIPAASPALPPTGGAVALALMAMLLALTLWLRRIRPAHDHDGEGIALRIPPYAACAAAVVLITAFNLWSVLRPSGAAGQLDVVFAEAGGAPVTLIAGPAGERILIDTGPSALALARAVDPLLPPTDRRVSLIVLTRSSITAAGGLSGAVERYAPRAVLAESVATIDDDLNGAWLGPLVAGMSITLSSGVRLTFEPPAEEGGRWRIAAVWRNVRIALTPGTVGDVILTRAGQEAPGAFAVEVTATGLPAYSVRQQGPIRVSTDGTALRTSVSRGPVITVPATGDAASRARQ